jgi:transposase
LNSFRRYVLELSRIGTIADVAGHLGVGWDLVKEIQKEYLVKNYSRSNLENVEYIAIDEFAIEKGHKYMTVVYDPESGIILHAAKGKGAESLDGFWRRINKPLSIVYYLKEELNLIWEQENREQVEKVLGTWVAKTLS